MKILVFRIGQLGDIIISLPSIWAIRKQFPNASMTLLCDYHPNRKLVMASDLLSGSGIFDHFISYEVGNSIRGRLLRKVEMFRLLVNLRLCRFDALVYLAPSARTREQVERDCRFFKLAGIRRFYGMKGFVDLPKKRPNQPLEATSSEADLLLARLAADGIPIPAQGKGSLDLRLGEKEERQVSQWIAGLKSDAGRTWLGIGPGSKMPAKRWPKERFEEVVQQLIAEFDIWPVIFGGEEDRLMGDDLIKAWDRGYNAAGSLSLRCAASALRRCRIFLGNDTGTMHLAASVGVPSVAVFSSRGSPGMWNPYGVQHRVFRSSIECEGCGLIECIERRNECIRQIQPRVVLQGCAEMLNSLLKPGHFPFPAGASV